MALVGTQSVPQAPQKEQDVDHIYNTCTLYTLMITGLTDFATRLQCHTSHRHTLAARRPVHFNINRGHGHLGRCVAVDALQVEIVVNERTITGPLAKGRKNEFEEGI